MDKTERINVAVEPEVKHLAERAAAKAERQFSEWVRRAIRTQAKAELGEAA